MSAPDLRLPDDLLPQDGRFGSGPSKVRPAQLVAYCRSQLAGFKCPRSVEIVDRLPRTAMGKLDKRVLRTDYGAGVAVSGGR